MANIFSFDVFDTSITRILARPQDLFLLIAYDSDFQSIDSPEALKRSFHPIRVKCEIMARIDKGKGEITLRDIYRQMVDRYNIRGATAKKIMDLEIEMEKKAVRPIAWTIDRINKLRNKGAKIVFISDMYLPSDVIRQMLEKVGAFKEGDRLYVSNEIGFTKGSGKLFRHVIDNEKCAVSQLTHFGDNLYSDILVPFRIGMRIFQAKDVDLEKFLKKEAFRLLAGVKARSFAKSLLKKIGRNS